MLNSGTIGVERMGRRRADRRKKDPYSNRSESLSRRDLLVGLATTLASAIVSTSSLASTQKSTVPEVLTNTERESMEAIVRRLEELGLAKAGTWDWFQANGGITDEHVRQVLGDLAVPDPQKAEADYPTTLRLNLLAAEAYRQELMSEGQLARLLCLDRVELRGILDSQESEGIEADGITIESD